MKTNGYKLLLVLLFLPLLLNGGVITRDGIISKAETYLHLNWSPSVDTCVIKDWQGNKINSTFHSYYKRGQTYTWEAYVWGGVNTTASFINRINSGYCAGGYNTSCYGYFYPGHPEYMSAASHFLAGLDCAAFVNSCLSQPIGQGIDSLRSRCILINRRDVKKGDIWVIAHHIRLADGNGYVYESHSEKGYRPGVEHRAVSNVSYTPYSIFPQFSNPQPPPYSGHVGKEFDVSIEVTGSGKIKNPVVTVNGQKFEAEYNEGHITAHVEFEGLPGKGWGVWMAYHIVVQCDNYVSAVDNYYRDSYDWIVYPDTAPPVVVSTDPSNNENNVPIDKGKVIIKFSKPMDENSTEGAISIVDEYNMGIGIDSFAWEDSNKTMKIFIDTLDYFTEYRVTITDDAMSVDSVRLVRKRLPKNFNMYRIS